MTLHSRRRFLQAVTALTAGLAGCGGMSGSDGHSETAVAGGPEPPDSSETDPERLRVRADTERAPMFLADPDGETPESPAVDRPGPHVVRGVVDSREKADRLTLADDVVDSIDTTPDLEAFVEETAFDSETLYLENNAIGECFELELCWVAWQPGEIRTDYARRLRPYDEACSSDARAVESRLMRLPVALDGDEVNSFGTTVGTGSCDRGGGE